MKELKIFAIVVILSGVLYWGIEPYAHTQLHPHTSSANFIYSDEDINTAEEALKKKQELLTAAELSKDSSKVEAAKLSLKVAKDQVDKYKNFWSDIKKIDFSKGNAQRGEEIFGNSGCAGCHGVEVAGMEAPSDFAAASEAFGVVPPDLSTAGAIYDEHFLAALVKNPAMALKVDHKFTDERPFPMPEFAASGENEAEELADLVAYLKSLSSQYINKHNGISDERLFADACQRCHDIKYDKKYTVSNRVLLSKYVGSNPPDLSMMIRSKNSDNYLIKFINDTQKMLPGTAMPRVGLNEQSAEQIVKYMEKVGDSKKQERESLGIYIMIYFLILGIFATLWKRKVWRDLH